MGRTGLRVTKLGMGASRTMEPAVIKAALDSGINFFDTAPNYGLGTGEERLGKALKSKDRSKIVINTKFDAIWTYICKPKQENYWRK